MANVTRKGFIKQASVGAATVGALATVPGMATAHAAKAADAAELAHATAHGPLAAYVHDVSKGEIRLLVGTREVIVHDSKLVLRLVKAAHSK